MQWETTFKGLQKLLLLYFFGFVIPFIIAIFIKEAELAKGLMIVSLIVQLFFFAIEFAQFYRMRRKYFNSVWNLFDFG